MSSLCPPKYCHNWHCPDATYVSGSCASCRDPPMGWVLTPCYRSESVGFSAQHPTKPVLANANFLKGKQKQDTTEWPFVSGLRKRVPVTETPDDPKRTCKALSPEHTVHRHRCISGHGQQGRQVCRLVEWQDLPHSPRRILQRHPIPPGMFEFSK
jgi:hypothetical protein